jgi:hypothetical protein
VVVVVVVVAVVVVVVVVVLDGGGGGRAAAAAAVLAIKTSVNRSAMDRTLVPVAPWRCMYKQVEKELSEIKKPEEDRLKKAFERVDVDRDGAYCGRTVVLLYYCIVT